MPSPSSSFEFGADIRQLLSLIINAFYSEKDSFLRELLSNSSDALTKYRSNHLESNGALDEKDELRIDIIPDKNNNTLLIQDTGIGMTKDELIQNLGTIARSGTKAFMEAVKAGTNLSMIGQFGVGFYSAFLVADRVDVESRVNVDSPWFQWSSEAGNSFSISELESNGASIAHGTRLILHLKRDMHQYLEENKIREIIKRHSQYLEFPIYLHVQKSVPKAKEFKSKEPTTESDSLNDHDSLNDSEKDGKVDDVQDDQQDNQQDEIKDGDAPDTKEQQQTELKTETEQEHLNKQKPIWLCKPEDVTKEEYHSFYKSLSHDYSEPCAHKHFKAEGNLEFNAILFIPKRAPFDMFQSNNSKRKNVKLYVRRVFVTDDAKEIVPDWLDFVHYVVDSEDLPLNVSREMLQHNKILKTIGKVLVKRTIELFGELKDQQGDVWNSFYEQFAKNIKLGIHEDATYREKLAGLLQFRSSESDEKSIGFDDYIERSKVNNTKYIFYITGENLDSVKKNPCVEAFINKEVEVLFCIDTMDEFALQQLHEYKDRKLVCITKDAIDWDALLTEDERKLHDVTEAEWDKVAKSMKEILGNQVEKVVLSRRLVNTPCCITTSEFGWSANMERIMKAQALRDPSMNSFMTSKKIFEINPNHKLVQYIRDNIHSDVLATKQAVQNILILCFQTSLLASGFSLDDLAGYTNKMYNLLSLECCSVNNSVLESTQRQDESDTTGNTPVDQGNDHQMEAVD